MIGEGTIAVNHRTLELATLDFMEPEVLPQANLLDGKAFSMRFGRPPHFRQRDRHHPTSADVVVFYSSKQSTPTQIAKRQAATILLINPRLAESGILDSR
ncbi:hypothetical protein [Sinorhizobium meliloti]|uniref:hypothetical protein n=1 Tax=Rhizobium meliloti TaxID=382 RepID=UPI0020C128C9|nr:hypothetical protein [Sinorhizobium meliloti]